jgi:hypothetical protein
MATHWITEAIREQIDDTEVLLTLAKAIERHKAAEAAMDATGQEGCPGHLLEVEIEALDELAFTPCASDAEFG